MNLNFATIASSSSGNCIFVGTENTNILIDAGLSGKKIEQGLDSLGLTGNDIDGIFVTHEHSDHVKGIGVLSHRYNIPVYATEGTWGSMPSSVGQIRPSLMHDIYAEEFIAFNDLSIKAFDIPHDAAQPVGYTIAVNNTKITVATDIGHITDTVLENVKGASLVLLESNHDVDMLRRGGYPEALKSRILSDYGHLSNKNAGKLLNTVIDSSVKYVLLGHLSKENNTPRLAYDTVSSVLEKSGAEIGGDFDMWVAPSEGVNRKISLL